MRQTKESNKRAPGRVVIHIRPLVLIYTLTFSNVLLVLALNLIVHKSSYCKCSLAWCQARTFLLFTIWTHPLQMREHPLQYASTDKNKKSHYRMLMLFSSLSDNLLQDNHSIFWESVDNFEMMHKTCAILVWVQFPRKGLPLTKVR